MGFHPMLRTLDNHPRLASIRGLGRSPSYINLPLCLRVSVWDQPLRERSSKAIMTILYSGVINNFQHSILIMLCDSRKLGWPIYPFKIRHCACLLEKREKDIKKVRWIIYHLSTIEDCTFTYLGRRQFSKISHEFLKERIEGEDNGRVNAFLQERCRQV